MPASPRALAVLTALVMAAAAVLPGRSPVAARQERHAALDHVLDTYVREGRVYYRALKAERAGLDRYLRSLDVPPAELAGWTPAEQQAFWLNAYNAIVLRTIIDEYPIRTRTDQYPERSIRQIPGAFESETHRVAGRAMTLDGIETHMLATFGDARLSLGLGRGALGSPRLRSEAFTGERLEAQLREVLAECATRLVCSQVDLEGDRLVMSPIVGWREEAFIRTFEPQAAGRWAARSPIERAAAALVYPHVFGREQEVLTRGTFRMVYREFDWRLNESGSEEFSTDPAAWVPEVRRSRRTSGTKPAGSVENSSDPLLP